MKKTLLSFTALVLITITTQAQIIISGFLANPSGTDSPYEYVQLRATQDINFATTPYTVVFCNNGTAASNGWIAGGSVTYNLNLTTGTVTRGDIFYVGGSGKLINGLGSTDISSEKWIATINTGTTAGDNFGNLNTAGVLGNGGANADGVAVFSGLGSALLATTIPIDGVFFGTGVGTAKPATGGLTVPNNDIYSTAQGTFGNGTNTTVFTDAGSSQFIKLTGTYNTGTSTWTTPRTSSIVTLTASSTTTDLGSTATLPISLTSFSGKAVNESVLLNWETASESNNDYFEVLKSSNGKTFTAAGTVKGSGTTKNVKSYSLVDNNPAAGTNYYQLVQYDFDGKNSKSEIISVNSAIASSSLTVYADASLVNVSINSANSTEGTLQIFDLSGKKLNETKLSLTKGFNILSLPLSLNSGIHVVNFVTTAEVIKSKFIKE